MGGFGKGLLGGAVVAGLAYFSLGYSLTASIGLGTSAFGLINQYTGGQAAQKAASQQASYAQQSAAEQRAQFASQQKIADIANARARAEKARQGRIAAGTIANSGANAGVSTSSGVQGGIGSVQTQTASNLGTFNAVAENQVDILNSQARQGSDNANAGAAGADLIQARANISSGQNIFNIGTGIFKEGGGFKTIFDGQQKQGPVTDGYSE